MTARACACGAAAIVTLTLPDPDGVLLRPACDDCVDALEAPPFSDQSTRAPVKDTGGRPFLESLSGSSVLLATSGTTASGH
jgi:hypothetical protein